MTIRYYLEKKDKEFEAKAKEVLLLYKKVEWITQLLKKYGGLEEEITLVNQEIFISYDERPGIQAEENKHKDRNLKLGKGSVRCDYEYIRHGTFSLLAEIDLLTGKSTASSANLINHETSSISLRCWIKLMRTSKFIGEYRHFDTAGQ